MINDILKQVTMRCGYYFAKNEEELNQYELKSCIKLIKKNNSKDERKLIDYLYRKGYSKDIIKEAIDLA